MKYLAGTIVDYIAQETTGAGTFRFVLPSYPSQVLVEVGRQLEERFARAAERRITLVYGIAYRLGQQWRRSGTAEDELNLELVRARGWYNEDNNLTSIRNMVREPGRDETLVALIAGYDHIDDQASLRDFFHLDQQNVWDICLRRSFVPWVEARCRQAFDLEDYQSEVTEIAEVLSALYDHGLTDLPHASAYLERLDLSNVSSGSDAYRLVLESLSAFNLPRMPGLARGSGRKGFGSYIGPAQEFFNYGAFLDESARRKAIKAIDDYEASNQPAPAEGTLGAYESLQQFLASLRRYIGERSETDRQLLLTVDFPFLLDKVLGYRKRGPRQKRAPRRLRGLPPEVFLRALWLTLGDYAKEARSDLVLPEEDLREVRLESLLFKHDFDAGDEDAAGAQADDLLAGEFLRKALGGLDKLLQDHVQLGDSQDGQPVKITSRLCPGDSHSAIAYQKTTIGEPSLKFRVQVIGQGDEPFGREFLWCLPQYHQTRLLVDLLDWAYSSYQNTGNALPAWTVPYVPEVFLARDEDEVNRVFSIALSNQKRGVEDLLTAVGIEPSDPLRHPLLKLSHRYQGFLNEARSLGFFTALDNSYDDLRVAYADACETYIRCHRNSSLGPLLFKAFSIFDSRETGASDWKWREYAECFIATPLHPAVLDMIRHQHSFLCESLGVYATDALKQPGGRQFAENRWDWIADLAKVERPVFGTIKNTSGVLDSNVRGYGYVHLVGECHSPSDQLAARLLLDYDAEEDEDITDADLFRETRASQLVANTLRDYRKLHAHADDGVAVGALCGRGIQPLIAGVDAYLESVLRDRDDRPYSLRLVVFSASRDDSSILRWLQAWRDRWQDAELSPAKEHYSRCRISISYRVVADEANRERLGHLLRRTPLDVMFFTDFVRADASRFLPVDRESFPDDYRKFPVLEKACCPVLGGGHENRRERLLSNNRFVLAAGHAEVMARLGRQGSAEEMRRHVLLSYSNFQPWVNAVDAAHESSAWVVCIDPAVDEQLLRRTTADGAKAREIIGFGTGVGAHGENNYTVSTEQFAISDIKKRVSAQLSARLGLWDKDTCDRVASSLVAEASRMSGLSVVKATGPSEYVRDYVAYATTRRLLPRDPDAFCDEIISLDAFRHWFDSAEDGMRPDLLRLRARIVDGYFDIEAQVIECKFAQSSESHLSKGHDQVEAGLRELVSRIRPREEGKPIGIGDRPDQRYWWMQIHRLIASRGSTSKPNYAKTLAALERLSEGYFNITWQGAVMAFWTDVDRDSLVNETERVLSLEGTDLVVPSFSAGCEFIRRVALEGLSADIFANVPRLSLRFNRASTSGAGESDAGEAGTAGQSSTTKEEDATGGDKTEPSVAGTHVGNGDSARPMSRGIPQRIPLGVTTAGGKEVFWEFGHPDLTNRHILVFGASGTGKTYTIQALLVELGNAGQNVLIVDYTNGFTTNQLETVVKDRLRPRQHLIRKEPLTINPFRRQCDFIDDEPLEEDPTITGQRVSGVFAEVYNLGDQQRSVLYSVIRAGVAEEGPSFNLSSLVRRLEILSTSGGPLATSAASVVSKIQPFVDMTPFGAEDQESWERIFNDDESRCHIIQMAGFSKDMARLITEFTLIDLYRYYRTRGTKDKPRIIVLDEIQNLDHRLESPLGQFLTEGRKFGISLILATQTLSNLDKDERDRLFQASHKLFFKPADTELKSFGQILESATGEKADDWVKRLASLARGECYSLGPAMNDSTGALETKRHFKIRIKSLGERL